MGQPVTVAALRQFARRLSVSVQSPSDMYLIGGAALIMMGSVRMTTDVDFVGDDTDQDDDPLHRLIQETALNQKLDLEAVPFGGFMPALPGAGQRHILLGTFGNLRLWMFDPVAIATSKLDRGLESDIEDIRFMLARGLVTISQLQESLNEVTTQARKFDFDIQAMKARLASLRS